MRFTDAEKSVLFSALALRVSDLDASADERRAATTALRKITLPVCERPNVITRAERFHAEVSLACNTGARVTLGPGKHIGPWPWSVDNHSLVCEATSPQGTVHVLLSVFEDGGCGVRLFGDHHMRETDPMAIHCEVYLSADGHAAYDTSILIKTAILSRSTERHACAA